MKAAIYTKRDSRKVLELVDIDQPVPKKDEVLIKVRAASVNPLDWRLKSHRPGVDLAGEVASIGSGVARFKAGDAVFGLGKGAFAESARARESQLAAKPEGVTFEQAASLPIAGLTALQGLRDKGKLVPGQKVLINGAAGGVGTFAVQIAKVLGAEVTGVCSTRNTGLVASIGADAVIDYTREDFTRGTCRFDVIVDNVANHPLSHCRRVLTPEGALVPKANARGRRIGGYSRTIKALVMARFVPQRIRPFLAAVNHEDLLTLAGLIESGKITPVIDRTYPLSQVPDAIRYLEQ